MAKSSDANKEPLPEFQKFLLERKLAPEKNIPYYVKWVSDCYRFFDIPETQPLNKYFRCEESSG